MLGSIEKYRPNRKPTPYSNEQRNQLQQYFHSNQTRLSTVAMNKTRQIFRTQIKDNLMENLQNFNFNNTSRSIVQTQSKTHRNVSIQSGSTTFNRGGNLSTIKPFESSSNQVQRRDYNVPKVKVSQLTQHKQKNWNTVNQSKSMEGDQDLNDIKSTNFQESVNNNTIVPMNKQTRLNTQQTSIDGDKNQFQDFTEMSILYSESSSQKVKRKLKKLQRMNQNQLANVLHQKLRSSQGQRLSRFDFQKHDHFPRNTFSPQTHSHRLDQSKNLETNITIMSPMNFINNETQRDRCGSPQDQQRQKAKKLLNEVFKFNSNVQNGKDRRSKILNSNPYTPSSTLHDQFLPALMAFSPSNRIKLKSNKEQISEFRKELKERTRKQFQPKQLQSSILSPNKAAEFASPSKQEQEHPCRPMSLLNKQKMILVQAQQRIQPSVKGCSRKQGMQGKSDDVGKMKMITVRGGSWNVKSKHGGRRQEIMAVEERGQLQTRNEREGNDDRDDDDGARRSPSSQDSFKYLYDSHTEGDSCSNKGNSDEESKASDCQSWNSANLDPSHPQYKPLAPFKLIKMLMRLKKKKQELAKDIEVEKQGAELLDTEKEGSSNKQDSDGKITMADLLKFKISDEVYLKCKKNLEERHRVQNAKNFAIRKQLQNIINRGKEKREEALSKILEEERILKEYLSMQKIGDFQEEFKQIYQTQNAKEDTQEMYELEDDQIKQVQNQKHSDQVMVQEIDNKTALAPQKQFMLDSFAKTMCNGIIWNDIKDCKVDPKVLTNKNLVKNLGLTRILQGTQPDTTIDFEEMQNQTNKFEQSAKQQKQAVDLFKKSKNKYNFYEIAKMISKNKSIRKVDLQCKEIYRNFYQECLDSNILTIPLFTEEQNNVLSVVGKQINSALAKAVAKTLEKIPNYSQKTPQQNPIRSQISQDLSFVQLRELILEDNGLKDEGFASILEALQTQSQLVKLSYSRNEIGPKTLAQLSEMLLQYNSQNQLCNLRFTSLICTKQNLQGLLKTLREAPRKNAIKHLKISHCNIDNFVLMNSLIDLIREMPQLIELNLSSNKMFGQQFTALIQTFNLHLTQIRQLNIGYNIMPQDIQEQDIFIASLKEFVQTARPLVCLDIAGIGLRKRINDLMVPLASSSTLQSIHLSDNQIPKNIERSLLMVFKIKESQEKVFYNVNSVVREALTKDIEKPVINFQHQIERIRAEKQQRALYEYNENLKKIGIEVFTKPKPLPMISTYEEASAKIANAQNLREMRDKKNYVESTMKSGANCIETCYEPFILSRYLGHKELVFNLNKAQNTYYTLNSGSNWHLNEENQCWVCDKWKYCSIFFSRKDFEQHYNLIIDPNQIRLLNDRYKLVDQNSKQSKNNSAPLIFGSITGHVVCQMSSISMFNILLDQDTISQKLGQNTFQGLLRSILNNSQGIEQKFGSQLNLVNNDDWLSCFIDFMPFPMENYQICNLPESKANSLVLQRLACPKELFQQRQQDSVHDVFVFAGYLKPGKHQVFIKDQKTNTYYGRDLIIDIRDCEIEENPKLNQNGLVYNAIERFVSCEGQEEVNLDNSIFMNFVQYTKEATRLCFKHDWQNSLLPNLLAYCDELTFVNIENVLLANYSDFCEFFHEITANLDQFPSFPVSELVPFFQETFSLGETCDQTSTLVNEILKEYNQQAKQSDPSIPPASSSQTQPLQCLNRQNFLDILILGLYKVTLDSKQSLASSLQTILTTVIVPYIKNKTMVTEGDSLFYFRNKYVWQEEVNDLLYDNLEGLIHVFQTFTDQTLQQFNLRSALKLLEQIGCPLTQLDVGKQFNLSQMTVIDERVVRAEYSDMEFIEFLEFIIRVAYKWSKATQIDAQVQKPFQECLVKCLTQILLQTPFTLVVNERKEKITGIQAEQEVKKWNKFIRQHTRIQKKDPKQAQNALLSSNAVIKLSE